MQLHCMRNHSPSSPSTSRRYAKPKITWEKQFKTLKAQNALKNVRDSFDTLTQNWLCILHDGCLNRIPRTEFNVKQVFLWKFGDSGLITKYENYHFFAVIFHFAEKRKGILQNGLQIRTPRPRFPIRGRLFKIKNVPLIIHRSTLWTPDNHVFYWPSNLHK